MLVQVIIWFCVAIHAGEIEFSFICINGASTKCLKVHFISGMGIGGQRIRVAHSVHINILPWEISHVRKSINPSSDE